MNEGEGLPAVPGHVLGMSRRALDLHDPSLPVAHLAADSLMDPDLEVPQGATRRLLFEHADLGVDIVLRAAGGVTLVQVRVVRDGPDARALLVPSGHDFAELVQPPERTKLALTAGEGTLADIRPGLTSIVLHGAAGVRPRTFRTAWFTV